jgi:hypothetical protein
LKIQLKNFNLIDGKVIAVPSGAVTSIKQAKICPSVVKDINLYSGFSMKSFQKLWYSSNDYHSDWQGEFCV